MHTIGKYTWGGLFRDKITLKAILFYFYFWVQHRFSLDIFARFTTGRPADGQKHGHHRRQTPSSSISVQFYERFTIMTRRKRRYSGAGIYMGSVFHCGFPYKGKVHSGQPFPERQKFPESTLYYWNLTRISYVTVFHQFNTLWYVNTVRACIFPKYNIAMEVFIWRIF